MVYVHSHIDKRMDSDVRHVFPEFKSIQPINANQYISPIHLTKYYRIPDSVSALIFQLKYQIGIGYENKTVYSKYICLFPIKSTTMPALFTPSLLREVMDFSCGSGQRTRRAPLNCRVFSSDYSNSGVCFRWQLFWDRETTPISKRMNNFKTLSSKWDGERKV